MMGTKQAVVETWRNLTAVGADPLAITDNMNFANPERPEVMGQFVGSVQGMGEACRVLDYPVVSGNVSLYNETNGVGIPPTPAIGGVGLIPDVSRMADIELKREGDLLIVIGREAGLARPVALSAVSSRASSKARRRRSISPTRSRPARSTGGGAPSSLFANCCRRIGRAEFAVAKVALALQGDVGDPSGVGMRPTPPMAGVGGMPTPVGLVVERDVARDDGVVEHAAGLARCHGRSRRTGP